jgi:hypothetical protein
MQGSVAALAPCRTRRPGGLERFPSREFTPRTLPKSSADSRSHITVYCPPTTLRALNRATAFGRLCLCAFGGETMLENFSFSSSCAYMIRDGRIAEMVKDVILAGNLFTTLMNIAAISDDFTVDYCLPGALCATDS